MMVKTNSKKRDTCCGQRLVHPLMMPKRSVVFNMRSCCGLDAHYLLTDKRSWSPRRRSSLDNLLKLQWLMAMAVFGEWFLSKFRESYAPTEHVYVFILSANYPTHNAKSPLNSDPAPRTSGTCVYCTTSGSLPPGTWSRRQASRPFRLETSAVLLQAPSQAPQNYTRLSPHGTREQRHVPLPHPSHKDQPPVNACLIHLPCS